MSRYAVQIVGPAGSVTYLMADYAETGDPEQAVLLPSIEIADLVAIGLLSAEAGIHKGLIIAQAVDLDAEPRE